MLTMVASHRLDAVAHVLHQNGQHALCRQTIRPAQGPDGTPKVIPLDGDFAERPSSLYRPVCSSCESKVDGQRAKAWRLAHDAQRVYERVEIDGQMPSWHNVFACNTLAEAGVFVLGSDNRYRFAAGHQRAAARTDQVDRAHELALAWNYILDRARRSGGHPVVAAEHAAGVGLVQPAREGGYEFTDRGWARYWSAQVAAVWEQAHEEYRARTLEAAEDAEPEWGAIWAPLVAEDGAASLERISAATDQDDPHKRAFDVAGLISEAVHMAVRTALAQRER